MEMNIRIGTWYDRSLCKSSSLETVLWELVKYKLDLMGVHEVGWDRGGTEAAANSIFFYGNGNTNHH
jgi:hypothetical protein